MKKKTKTTKKNNQMKRILLFMFLIFCKKSAHMFSIPPYVTEELKNLKLRTLRFKIDTIDNTMYRLLEQRQRLSKETTPYKEGIRDPLREISIITRLQKQGDELDQEFVKKIWSNIFIESCRIQKENSITEESE